MRVAITKEFRFEAAHVIPHHQGKCSQPHGHSYRVVVEVCGPIQERGPQAGMVLDFADVKAAWLEIKPRLDHRDLNESLDGDVRWTTAEELALFLLRFFGQRLGPRVAAVTVWETATSSARVEW